MGNYTQYDQPNRRIEFDWIPRALRSRPQWLLWDSSADTPRRPHWDGNFAVSWSDPDEWHTFSEAKSKASEVDTWGVGYVVSFGNDRHMTGRYSVIDLDGCFKEPFKPYPKPWVPDIDEFGRSNTYIEYSPSGEGLHIWLDRFERPEWWKDQRINDGHEGIDLLTNSFVTVTGRELYISGPRPVEVDASDYLAEFCDPEREENAENPDPGRRRTSADSGGSARERTEAEIREMLGCIDPDIPYREWVRLMFAVYDWDSGKKGKRVFTEWSERGEKFDPGAKNSIRHLWNGSQEPREVTVGTLVYYAMEHGYNG